MKQVKRFWVIVLCIMIMSAPILASQYIIEETNHECTSETCPICMQIEVMAQTIQQFHSFISSVSFIMTLLCLSVTILYFNGKIRQSAKTLISLKVELLN